MDDLEINNNEDYVMRASYDSLIIDFNKTIDEFIVFTINDEVIEIEQHTGHRSKYIDIMIKYFESIEEFEKCKCLIDLKKVVINNGD